MTTEIRGTGRRKTSIARVRLIPGKKGFLINNKNIDEYLQNREILKTIIKHPLLLTETLSKYKVIANVKGGGFTGQAGAIRLGISRALIKDNESYRAQLKIAGFLTRDSRMVERKKFGKKKARKSSQFSKR